MIHVNHIEKYLMKALFARRLSKIQKEGEIPSQKQIAERVLRAFRFAVKSSAAYRAFLQENRVDHRCITTLDDFLAGAPLLSKKRFFNRFPIEDVYPNLRNKNNGRIWTSAGTSGGGGSS